KRARNTLARNRAWGQAGNVLSIEQHLSAMGAITTRHYVKARRLAGAVGTHDSGELTIRKHERDVFEHHANAEAHVKPTSFQCRHAQVPAVEEFAAAPGAIGDCRRERA